MKNKSFKSYLFTGLVSIIPLLITYWVISVLFNLFAIPGETIVSLFFNNVSNYIVQLVGFILTMLFIYLIGLFVSNVIGNKLYNYAEKIIYNIPIVNTVYNTLKQIISTIFSPKHEAFKKVVIIEYPRSGLWTICMVTGESKNQDDELFYHIYLPTTPNPTSGFMLFIKKKDVIETKMSVEEGLKAIISGGILANDINEIRLKK